MSRKLAGTAIIITLFSIFVKISGFIRESVMARQFGASSATDGYLLSFTFITLVVAMISNGFNNAFLPLYVKRNNEGMNDKNASSIINGIFLAFLVLSIIGYFFAEQLILLIFGDIPAETSSIAIDCTQIFLLFLSAVALNGMFESFLQAKRIFTPPHISRLFATLTSALFALFFDDIWGILSLAYGFVAGTLMGIILQGFFLWRSQFRWQPSVKIDKDIRNLFLALLVPAMLNAVVGQVNLFVNKIFATGTSEGAVTYLNSSSLIISIPTQIFATTLAAIIFTLLSEQTNQIRKFQNTVYLGLELSLVFLVPISAGLLIVGQPLIAFIYQGGAFTTQDTYNTYVAMLMYLPLIITQGMQIIVAKSMYALGKTSLLLKISITTIILNIILNALFVEPFGYPGLALSSSLVSLYYFTMSAIFLYRNLEKGELARAFLLIFRVGIATAIMLLTLYGLQTFTEVTGWSPFIQLMIFIPFGMIVYTGATFLFNRPSFNSILKTIRNK